jgi:Zn-dependent protease with chaperone function
VNRRTFPGITADAFTTEADRRALRSLEKVPLMPQVMRKFFELGLDQWLYAFNMSVSVRCGPNQYQTLHKILQECCEILDVPEPELYLTSNPFPNAFAGGVKRPYLVLRNSIVETLTDDELYALIGHELGHVKCGHVLYRTISILLFPLLEAIGRRTFGLGDAASIALALAFYEWFRQSEISADRAGLLACQNPETAFRTNLALTAGPNRLSNEMNTESFLEQARRYQEGTTLESFGKIVLFTTFSAQLSHPIPIHRAQLLDRWIRSGEYDRILAGDYPGAPKEPLALPVTV